MRWCNPSLTPASGHWTIWASQGYEVAWAQYPVPQPTVVSNYADVAAKIAVPEGATLPAVPTSAAMAFAAPLSPLFCAEYGEYMDLRKPSWHLCEKRDVGKFIRVYNL